MEKEFELFKREKRYVQNVSENTTDFYGYAFKAFQKHLPAKELSDIKSTDLIALVANMRGSGLSTSCTDAYIRGINPFLSWCFENGLTSAHLKIKRLKIEERVMKTFTNAQVKAIAAITRKLQRLVRLNKSRLDIWRSFKKWLTNIMPEVKTSKHFSPK